MTNAVTATEMLAALSLEHSNDRATMPAVLVRESAEAGELGEGGSSGSARLASHRALVGGLPVPALGMPARSRTARYTVTAVDARGRLADRAPLRVLRWAPGRSIGLVALPGALIATARPDGIVVVTGQGHLRLPADLRHALRLSVGDRLLVAAYADPGVLVAYTMPAVDVMVANYDSVVAAGELT